MEFWLKKSNSDKIMLPVNPESFAFTEKHNNTSVNVNSIGEVNLLGKRDLKTGTISSHFPKEIETMLTILVDRLLTLTSISCFHGKAQESLYS